MYPERELIRLSVHKAGLRREIAANRAFCAAAAAGVARPLAWLDRVMAFWRRLSPLVAFAAVPVGLLVQRMLFPRLKILGPLLRWGPLLVGALRGAVRP
jgi:hypothetical protein